MAAVNATADCCNGRHEDDTTPFLLHHVWDCEFGEDEGSAQVDLYGVVPFANRDIDNVWYSLAITSVTDEDIGAVTMDLVYFLV